MSLIQIHQSNAEVIRFNMDGPEAQQDAYNNYFGSYVKIYMLLSAFNRSSPGDFFNRLNCIKKWMLCLKEGGGGKSTCYLKVENDIFSTIVL